MDSSRDVREVTRQILARNAKLEKMISYLAQLEPVERGIFLELYMSRFCLYCNNEQPRDKDGRLGTCYCWKDC